MLRNPKKTLQSINNCVTVALPLTSIDVDVIVDKVKETLDITSIANMSDIDVETHGLEDGSLLIYNKEAQMWQSTKELKRQIINAGEY